MIASCGMKTSIDAGVRSMIPTRHDVLGVSVMRMTWAVITAVACIAFLAAPILAQSPEIEAGATHSITQAAKSLGIELQLERAVVTEVASSASTVAE